MLRIRLRRVGKKGRPYYRIIVAESSAPRDGAFVEWIGQYDPMANPPAVTLKQDRALAWLKQGAQPSDAVRRNFEWENLWGNASEATDLPEEAASSPEAESAE